ncbi:MAG: hypothetical protein ABIO70_21105 [Pseudomonadota bacterium]
MRSALPLLALACALRPAPPAAAPSAAESSRLAAAALGLAPYAPAPLPHWLLGSETVWVRTAAGDCAPFASAYRGTRSAPLCHATRPDGLNVSAHLLGLEVQPRDPEHGADHVLTLDPTITLVLESDEHRRAPAESLGRGEGRPLIHHHLEAHSMIPTLLLALLMAPQPAAACSCARFGHPTEASCASAERVFAGTLGAHRWPLRPELAWEPAYFEVLVDRVWRGDVPERIIASTRIGAGSCGVDTQPGWPILVCDHGGDLSLGMCGGSWTIQNAAELAATLGPAHLPEPGGERLFMANLGRRALLWSSPLLALGLAAVLGRASRRWGRLTTGKRLRLLRLAGVGAALVVLGRVLTTEPFRHHWWEWMFVPMLVATSLGALLALVAGRNPALFGGSRRALLAVLGLTGMWLAAGHARLHVPIDRPDVRACSIARAEAALATLGPDELDREGAQRALERAGHACTDWGLGRYAVWEGWWVEGACLTFHEHDGGFWAVCRTGRGYDRRYGWEGPS